MNGPTLDSLIRPPLLSGWRLVALGAQALGGQAGPGVGCEEICTLDPSSLCCLCPGGSTMDSSAGGKARPEAGEDKEGFLSKLKRMFTS